MPIHLGSADQAIRGTSAHGHDFLYSTIAWWFKKDTGVTTIANAVYGALGSGTSQLAIYWNYSHVGWTTSAGDIWIYQRGTNGQNQDATFHEPSGIDINDGEWHLFIYSVGAGPASTVQNVYIDGSACTRTERYSLDLNGMALDQPIQVGGYNNNGTWGTNTYDGYMAHYALWDIQLNATERSYLLYRPPNLVQTSVLLDYLPLRNPGDTLNLGTGPELYTPESDVVWVPDWCPVDRPYYNNPDPYSFGYIDPATPVSTCNDLEMSMQVSKPDVQNAFVLGSDDWWSYRRKQYRSRYRKGWNKEFTDD